MRLARGLILVLIISHARCKIFLGKKCFVLYAGQSLRPRALAKPLRGRWYFRAGPENVLDGSQHQLTIALIPLRQIQVVSWKQLKENWGQFSLKFLRRAPRGSHNKHTRAPCNGPNANRWASLFVKGSRVVIVC